MAVPAGDGASTELRKATRSRARSLRGAFVKGLGQAVKDKLNLIIAGSAALGAALFQSWSMLALAGAAYTALVAWDLSSADFWRNVLGTGPARRILPDPMTLTDPASQTAIRSIVAARQGLARVLADTKDEIKGHLARSLAAVSDLEERACALIDRIEELAHYLGTADVDAVRREIVRLDDRARRCGDPSTKLELIEARAVRDEHLRTLFEISDTKERICAGLDRIVGALEALPARVMRMRVLDTEAMDRLSSDVRGEIDGVDGDLRTFEETLRSLGVSARAMPAPDGPRA